MSGSIIFHPTAAGMDIQNQCLISGSPLPAIAAISCSDGVPHDNPYTATSLTGTQLHAVQTSATRKSASAIEFQAGFSPEGALTLTQLGVWLSNGVLFAYAVLPQPYFKGEGVGLSLPGVLSRQGLGDFQLDINILDVNALAEVIKNLALDRFAGAAAPIVTDYITPLERAVTYAWDVGIQRFQMEFFSERFSLRDTPPLAISGVIAGDDSIDLAGGNATLTAGDYVIFDGSRSEHVRIQSSLELGRRRLVNNILHTYPSAQLARTNWLIHSGEAECPAGSVYFAKRLRLIEGDVHRLYLRGLTAPGAPDVSWRTDHGDFIATPLARQTAIDSEWSDYAFDIPAGEYFHIRIVTPQATRLRAVVACNTLHDTRVVTPPVVVGDEAKPGVAMTLQLSASSRLSGGQIAQFDLVRDGVLSQHPATANQAAISLTFNGELGEQQRLIATAVDDLGNRSASVVHGVTLVDSLTPPVPVAPVLISPAAGATDVSLTPTLLASAFAGEGVHASTDWRIRDATDSTVVWQSLADSSHLTSISVPEGVLVAGVAYQVWVRYRRADGVETGWGSVGFVALASNAADTIGIVLVDDTVRHGFWQRVDANFNPVLTAQSAFDSHPVYSGIVDQLIDGQHMVKVPKFYCKAGIVPSGAYVGKMFWMVSSVPKEGFVIHPAFVYGLHEEYGSRERNQFWIGKYQASVSANKLMSVPSVKPMWGQGLTTAWSEAIARNVDGVSGFIVWSWKQLSAIKILMLIENGGCGGKLQLHGNHNQQLGNLSSAEYLSSADYGSSVDHGIVEVDSPLLAPGVGAGWRGIYGLWSNIGQVISGIILQGNGVGFGEGVDFTTYGYSPNVNGWGGGSAPLLYPQQVFGEANNYITKFNDQLPLAFLPSGYTNNIGESVPADGVRTVYDHNAPIRVLWAGWFATSEPEAIGAWTTFVAHGPTASGPGLGARLAKY